MNKFLVLFSAIFCLPCAGMQQAGTAPAIFVRTSTGFAVVNTPESGAPRTATNTATSQYYTIRTGVDTETKITPPQLECLRGAPDHDHAQGLPSRIEELLETARTNGQTSIDLSSSPFANTRTLDILLRIAQAPDADTARFARSLDEITIMQLQRLCSNFKCFKQTSKERTIAAAAIAAMAYRLGNAPIDPADIECANEESSKFLDHEFDRLIGMQCPWQHTPHGAVGDHAIWCPDGKSVVCTCGGLRDIAIWPTETGEPTRKWRNWGGSDCAAAFSPDKNLLATVASGHTVRFWRADNNHTEGEVSDSLNSGPITAIDKIIFSPNGLFIAAHHKSGNITVWRISDRSRLFDTPGNIDGNCAFSPDSTLIAFAIGTLAMLQYPEAGMKVRAFCRHKQPVVSVSFSPDGTLLASGSQDQITKLWRTADGSEVKTLEGGPVTLFSPDGTMLVAGKKIWSIPEGKLISTLTATDSPISQLSFNPDGTLLLAIHNDNSIKLWHVGYGALIHQLCKPPRKTFATFSPDGSTIAFGKDAGAVCFVKPVPLSTQAGLSNLQKLLLIKLALKETLTPKDIENLHADFENLLNIPLIRSVIERYALHQFLISLKLAPSSQGSA